MTSFVLKYYFDHSRVCLSAGVKVDFNGYIKVNICMLECDNIFNAFNCFRSDYFILAIIT